MNTKMTLRFLPLLVLTVLFCGCATMPKEMDRTALLKAEADKYWKFRFEDRYKDSYKMEDPDGLPAFDAYRDRAGAIKKIKLDSFAIDKADVDGDKGVVSVGIYFYLPQVPKAFRQALYDKWVFRDGRWLHKFPAE
jgi:hypothetical protein